MKPFLTNKAPAWLLAVTLAVVGPAHAAVYTQTNLVASTDAYGASIVDPSLSMPGALPSARPDLAATSGSRAMAEGRRTSLSAMSEESRFTRTIFGW